MKPLIVLSVLALSGCAIVGPIQPTGKGTFLVSSRVGGDPLSAALAAANGFCASRGQVATVLETQQRGSMVADGVNVQFACSDAEHQQPSVLRPDNGAPR
jgi:hypothetical protein